MFGRRLGVIEVNRKTLEKGVGNIFLMEFGGDGFEGLSVFDGLGEIDVI